VLPDSPCNVRGNSGVDTTVGATQQIHTPFGHDGFVRENYGAVACQA
jgi:hypothetical protein